MANVMGTNAHRTTLRHVSTSYRHLFGPPLLFMTPNVADTKLSIMSLMYEGAEVGKWRLLEQSDPLMPAKQEMLRRVAADPVSQAVATHVMIDLFPRHVLGVQAGGSKGFSDGVVSDVVPGVFGPVQAYFGPLETQGRGGLRGHFSVFVMDPVRGWVVDLLKHGECDEQLKQRLMAWRRAVLAKVGSVQFDSVEEMARQLGTGVAANPLPFSHLQRDQCYMNGLPETEDAGIMPPPKDSLLKEAPGDDVLDWRFALPQGPARIRPNVPFAEPVKDDGRLSFSPIWRRMPPYVSDMRGNVSFVGVGDLALDSVMYANAFMADAWFCFARSHLHSCMNTCWKHAGGGSSGDVVRVCRFIFFMSTR
jgi:hypothetical protein